MTHNKGIKGNKRMSKKPETTDEAIIAAQTVRG
jgi:hypothetical protein